MPRNTMQSPYGQYFWSFNVYTNHLGILLSMKILIEEG